MTWYVVVDENCTEPTPDEKVWTLSRNPKRPGWETDCGFPGYGLTKADAEELAGAIAEQDRLQEQLKKVTEERNELRAALRNRAG